MHICINTCVFILSLPYLLLVINRIDLNTYWQQILLIDKAVEFSKHHCSAELKAFLDVDAEIEASRAKVSCNYVLFIYDLCNIPHILYSRHI
jgi:hypothetical protein